METLTSTDIYTSDVNPDKSVNPKRNGVLWINYNTGNYFVCKDNTKDANVWLDVVSDMLSKLNIEINNLNNRINSAISDLEKKITDNNANTILDNYTDKISVIYEFSYPSGEVNIRRQYIKFYYSNGSAKKILLSSTTTRTPGS